MKKIFTLIAATMLVASAAQAQRITNLEVKEGETTVSPLTKFAAFKPENTAAKAGGLEMVFLPNQSFANLTVTPTLSANTVLKNPTAMPTDYTTNQLIEIESTDPAGVAFYNIIFKNIKPIALPVTYNFSEWTKDTEGWAGACVEASGENVKVGSTNRNFVLAFSDAPETLNYSIFVAAATWDAGNVFDIDASTDGITWTNIKKYDATNVMPLSGATIAEKEQTLALNANVKYVRFNYTIRIAGNVTVSKISVTKGEGTSITNNTSAKASAFVANGAKELSIVNAEEVAKVELFNVAGQNALVKVQPANTVSLNTLANGIYLVRLTLVDGSVATTKVIVK